MAKETWNRRKDIFYGVILSLGVSLLVYLSKSINELNKNVAIVIERQVWHDRAIQDNTNQIRIIKDKFQGR